jgi:hypothetical protein
MASAISNGTFGARRQCQSLVYILGQAGTVCWHRRGDRQDAATIRLAAFGTKGPRLHDWYYLELADLKGEEFNDESHGLWTRGC